MERLHRIYIKLYKLTLMQSLTQNGTTIFTARRSYASAVLGVVILSVRPSVCLSVTRVPKNLPAIFLYRVKEQSF